MEESDNNLSTEDNNSEISPIVKDKPKKRSLVERELETNLTARVTSPITNGEASSTSRYGRARRFKNDKNEADIYETVKTMTSMKSPKPGRSPKSPLQSPVYKMHASNSPIKMDTGKEHNLDNHIENIYNENISLSRFGSAEKKYSPVKKYPKVYIRKDLIQTKDKDKDTEETVVLIKNMFSPVKSGPKTKTSNNNLEKSSEKHSPGNKRRLSNNYLETLSVVKTLDFDDKKLKNDTDKKISLSKSELFELEAHSEYQVGDLAWARMGTYPFWPCIVTREPSSGLFVKKKLFGRNIRNIIHVTFFGDNGRRSWIADSMLRPFLGQLEFEAVRSQFTSETKKKDPKMYMAFFISDKKMPQWNISVEEAEMLMREPKRLRIDIFTNMLESTKCNKITPKSERSKKITRTDSDVSLSESLYDTLFSADDTITNDIDRTRTKKRNKSFDVSDVVTACLDNMAAKTGITKIQRQSHMDRWLLKAKTKTPEKSQLQSHIVQNIRKSVSKDYMNVNITQRPYSLNGTKNESHEDDNMSYLKDRVQKTDNNSEIPNETMSTESESTMVVHKNIENNICNKESVCNSLNVTVLPNDSNISISCAVSKIPFLSEVSDSGGCDEDTMTNEGFRVTNSNDTTPCDKDIRNKLIRSPKVLLDETIQDNHGINRLCNEGNITFNKNISNSENSNEVHQVQESNDNISHSKILTLRNSRIHNVKSKKVYAKYQNDNDEPMETFCKTETITNKLEKVVQKEKNDLENVTCNGVYNKSSKSCDVNVDIDKAADVTVQKNIVDNPITCNNNESIQNDHHPSQQECKNFFEKNKLINCNKTLNSKNANYRKFQLSLHRHTPTDKELGSKQTRQNKHMKDKSKCSNNKQLKDNSLDFKTTQISDGTGIEKYNGDKTCFIDSFNGKICDNDMYEKKLNSIFCSEKQNNTIKTFTLTEKKLVITNNYDRLCHGFNQDFDTNENKNINDINKRQQHQKSKSETQLLGFDNTLIENNQPESTLEITEEIDLSIKESNNVGKEHIEKKQDNVPDFNKHLDLEQNPIRDNINEPILKQREIVSNLHKSCNQSNVNCNSKNTDEYCQSILANDANEKVTLRHRKSESLCTKNSEDIRTTKTKQMPNVIRDQLLTTEDFCNKDFSIKHDLTKKELDKKILVFNDKESKSQNLEDNSKFKKSEHLPENEILENSNSENFISKMPIFRMQNNDNNKHVEQHKYQDPEFQKYFESQIDSVKDDNPELCHEELVSYLYKSWLYKQNLSSKYKNQDETDQTTLVKGANEYFKHTKSNKLSRKKSADIRLSKPKQSSIIINQVLDTENCSTKTVFLQNNLMKKGLKISVPEIEILSSKEKECMTQNPKAESTAVKKDNNNLEKSLSKPELNVSVNTNSELTENNKLSINKDKSDFYNTPLGQNKYEDEEFQTYLESQIDSVNDENPELSRKEIESYLYKTWLYKQNIPFNSKNNDKIDQTILDPAAIDNVNLNRLDKRKSQDEELTTPKHVTMSFVKTNNCAPKTVCLKDNITKEIEISVAQVKILGLHENEAVTENLEIVLSADNKNKDNLIKQILESENKIIGNTNHTNETDQKNTLIEPENMELSINNKKNNFNNKYLEHNKSEDPEFQKYLESQLDSVKHENSKLSQEEIVSHIYQSWTYKQPFNCDSKNMDENDPTDDTDKRDLDKNMGSKRLKREMSMEISEKNSKPLQENSCNKAQLEETISCSNAASSKSENKEADDNLKNETSLKIYTNMSFRLEGEINKLNDSTSAIIVEGGGEKQRFMKNCSEQVKYKDPNFQRYLEFKQDSVIEDNPDLSHEEIISYLYKIWLYEETVNFDSKKCSDYDQTSLIKGAKDQSYDKEPKNRKVSRKKVDNVKEITTNDIPFSTKDVNESEINATENYTESINKCKTVVVNNEEENGDDLEIISGSSETNIISKCDADIHDLGNKKPIDDDDENNDSASNTSEDMSLIRRRQLCKDKALQNERKNIEDLEFQRYVEMRQDSVMDEHPELSEDEIKTYLRKTWLYEEKLKTDQKRSDEVDQTSLVKGVDQEQILKRVRKKNKINKEDVEEDNFGCITEDSPKEKSKRSIIRPYYNEDLSDVEDEMGLFEIFRTKKKTNKSSLSDLVNEVHMETNNSVQEGNETSIAMVEEEEEIDLVEMYFEQLTTRKPNLFKGLMREKVCEICLKVGNLIKCKSCHCMFHFDCNKNQTNVIEEHTPNRGKKKKKKYRGRKPKNSDDTCLDSDCHGDDKIQDANSSDPNLSIENERVPLVFNAEDFEAKVSAKMKEIIDNPGTLEYHFESDKIELHWSDTEPGKCEVIEIKLCAKSQEEIVDHSNFKCSNCEKYDIPICFVCKLFVSPKDKVEYRQKCHVPQCYKYYHMECLKHWPQTQFNGGDSRHNKKNNGHFEALSCPRHVCHTCVSDDPRGCKTRFTSDKLARCVKCPATYHTFTKCLPAGSQVLTGSHIICPRHYEHRPGKVPCHVNTGWCFLCALGGTLICCEYCPTSFHAECLNIKPPEGGYMCEDCETGRLPLYGEMVWVKLGHYRWWPGIILHPSQIPPNILAVKHSPGEFVVRFFGQYDHYWVNRGRVFPFQEGDTGKISNQKSKIDAAFSLAVEHASRACEILKKAVVDDEESQDIASSLLPPHYVKLRVNKPVGSLTTRRPDLEESSLTQCECDPEDFEPCGPYSQCLNRMLLTECGPTCRAGDACNNRAFEKRQYPRMEPYRTPHRGWGLRTLETIRAGQFVIEYVGEVLDEGEFRRRMQRMHEVRDENFYFLTLDKERMIDAGPKGNLARFMNHSCEPNCETQKWTVLGDVRVGLFALYDIPPNSELTFNYNLESAGIEKKRCMCGAKRCSGYIGAKPKQDDPQPKKNKPAAKKMPKKRRAIELSPASRNKPKQRSGRPPKPKELTEIEKDLLIIKNATHAGSSDSETSGRLSSVDSRESRGAKRKRAGNTANDLTICLKRVKTSTGVEFRID